MALDTSIWDIAIQDIALAASGKTVYNWCFDATLAAYDEYRYGAQVRRNVSIPAAMAAAGIADIVIVPNQPTQIVYRDAAGETP